MQDLQKALPHLLMATIVIAAAVVLAVTHEITGGAAVAMIGTAGGFTLGGTVASGSISTVAGVSNAFSQPPSQSASTTPTQVVAPTPTPQNPAN